MEIAVCCKVPDSSEGVDEGRAEVGSDESLCRVVLSRRVLSHVEYRLSISQVQK